MNLPSITSVELFGKKKVWCGNMLVYVNGDDDKSVSKIELFGARW